jgi:hypothetical protein
MDFSLTTLFVVPVGNTLPTTGSTQNLTPGQFGIFLNTYAAATAGNIPNAPYIYLAQGRLFQIPGTATKKSDKISTSRIKDWYVVTGQPQSVLQITDIGNFTVPCGIEITLTFRLFSSYISTGYFNGLTRSITVPTPCCACGSSPCTDVDNQALIDSIVAAAQLDQLLTKFLTFVRVGVGSAAVLQVSANPLTVYGVPCDVAAFPFEFDRIDFYSFVYAGPETTQDFITSPNACNTVASVTILQRSSYAKGSVAEVLQMEKDYSSYQTPDKSLFRAGGLGVGYNGTFEDFTTAGTTYDMLYLRYYVYDDRKAYDPVLAEDAADIIMIPQSLTAGISTVLTAYLGAPTTESGTQLTTTTSTSTSTSSTTSTTTTGQEP